MSAAAAWSEAVAPVGVPHRPRLHLVPTGDAVPAPRPRRLRITRRGRLAMTLTVAVLIAVAAVSAWGRPSMSGPVAARDAVTVSQGESLSDIAARELPDLPVDRGVVALVEANHLPSDQVLAGQQLVVPAR